MGRLARDVEPATAREGAARAKAEAQRSSRSLRRASSRVGGGAAVALRDDGGAARLVALGVVHCVVDKSFTFIDACYFIATMSTVGYGDFIGDLVALVHGGGRS